MQSARPKEHQIWLTIPHITNREALGRRKNAEALAFHLLLVETKSLCPFLMTNFELVPDTVRYGWLAAL